MPSIHDDIEWDLGRSDYVPQEYVRPWDREGWDGSDVAVTPPREKAWKPNKPGFQQGQRDYQYMATEKEQRRERARELADQAKKEGVDWRERQLPREAIANRRSDPPEKVYGNWREAEMPKEREVSIQPVPSPQEGRWGERIGFRGIGTADFIDSDGDQTDDRYQRGPGQKRERAFDVRRTGRGVNTSPTQNLGRDLMMAIFRRR